MRLTRRSRSLLATESKKLLETAKEKGAEAGLHRLPDAPFEKLMGAWLTNIEHEVFGLPQPAQTQPAMGPEPVPPTRWEWLRDGVIGLTLGAGAAYSAFRGLNWSSVMSCGFGAFTCVLYILNVFPFRRWIWSVQRERTFRKASREQHYRVGKDAYMANLREHAFAAYHHEKTRAIAIGTPSSRAAQSAMAQCA